MLASQSLMTTRRGEFRTLYRALARKPAAFASTPIVFCEGDSWFSTPLSMNLLDWLVFPASEDEKKGVPLFGAGGLFFLTKTAATWPSTCSPRAASATCPRGIAGSNSTWCW
ncbi:MULTISPECIES: hypothetical protein [unclassified Pseudoxanthomonas]|uniref:hypothetical protein n=1 Tax=unclassified Pseudoxanthomonas TaxID=2645906 RepID=UPI00307F9813